MNKRAEGKQTGIFSSRAGRACPRLSGSRAGLGSLVSAGAGQQRLAQALWGLPRCPAHTEALTENLCSPAQHCPHRCCVWELPPRSRVRHLSTSPVVPLLSRLWLRSEAWGQGCNGVGWARVGESQQEERAEEVRADRTLCDYLEGSSL